MATNYEIDFTDQNPERVFQISAYTSDGPINPGSDTLPSSSTVAHTSLLLTGKGFPNYGELVAENFVHLIENFSNSTEPNFPISGQIWYDTSGDWDDPAGSPVLGDPGAPVLRVYNSTKHVVTINHPGTPDAGLISTITIIGDFTARFYNGRRIRTFDNVTGAQSEYLCASASGLDANGNTFFAITPTPGSTLVGSSTVGGWDRVMQENSNFLSMDLSAADPVTSEMFNIVNLADPVDPQDASTKAYVDNAILAFSTLNDLTDVTITAPAFNNFLVYDGGIWVNKSAATIGVLELSGGTMTGYITLHANPILDFHAATKEYVDTAVGGGGITDLDSLTDVTITGIPFGESVLSYNSGTNQWVNIDFLTWQLINNVVTTTEDAQMVARFFLGGDPIGPAEAATKNYVDTEESYILSGSFDGGQQVLNITQTGNPATHGGSPAFLQNLVEISGWEQLDTYAINLLYTVEDPESSLVGYRGLFLESVARAAGQDYPIVTGQQIFSALDIQLGRMSKPRDRAVFDADGNAIVDTSVAGAYGDLKFDYVPGYSKLQVYDDGLKRIASEHGWLRVAADTPAGSPLPKGELWPGYPTGLDIFSTYEFDIQLNLGDATASPVFTVIFGGVQAQTLGVMMEAINEWADTNPYTFAGTTQSVPPFGVRMFDGRLVFYSSMAGTGSAVDIADGTGVNLPLFANITGAALVGGDYLYTINPATINTGERNDGTGTNAPAPLTRHYREIGRVGRASYMFEWEAGSVPAGSPASEIEIISDHDIDYSQLLQP